MFLVFLFLRCAVGCLDVDVAGSICLAVLPRSPASGILLSWGNAPMMFACVCETSIAGFVITVAHLRDKLQIWSATSSSHASYIIQT